MLGAAGALGCLAAGLALGSWMRERRLRRLQLLQAQTDAVSRMRLLLEQERPSVTELLDSAGRCVAEAEGARPCAMRLLQMAKLMKQQPLLSTSQAYEACEKQFPAPWEQAEERMAMTRFFHQLGSGTAAMREQAAASCLRRLRPLAESAQAEADRGGKLCVQLGALMGIMAGIALW